MKYFATIINFEEKQRILAKTKKRTLSSSRFEAVCKSVIVCRRPQGSLRRCGGRMERHSFSPMRHAGPTLGRASCPAGRQTE